MPLRPEYESYRLDAMELLPSEVLLRNDFDTWLPERIFDSHVHNALPEHVGEVPVRALRHMMSTFPWNTIVDSRVAQKLLYPNRHVRALRFSKALPGIDYRAVNVWLRQQVAGTDDLFALFGLQDDIDYTTERLHEWQPSALKMYYFVSDPPGTRILDVFPVEILSVCEELETPIILHLPRPITESIAELATIRDMFPSLKIVLAHLGMALYLRPGLADAFSQAAKLGVWMDTACMEYGDVVKLALDCVGDEKIMFGSDEPLSLLRAAPYRHPAKGPRISPRMKYHWVQEDEWRDYSHIGQAALANHWQQLSAIREAVVSNSTVEGLKERIFAGNAEALFGESISA